MGVNWHRKYFGNSNDRISIEKLNGMWSPHLNECQLKIYHKTITGFSYANNQWRQIRDNAKWNRNTKILSDQLTSQWRNLRTVVCANIEIHKREKKKKKEKKHFRSLDTHFEFSAISVCRVGRVLRVCRSTALIVRITVPHLTLTPHIQPISCAPKSIIIIIILLLSIIWYIFLTLHCPPQSYRWISTSLYLIARHFTNMNRYSLIYIHFFRF